MRDIRIPLGIALRIPKATRTALNIRIEDIWGRVPHTAAGVAFLWKLYESPTMLVPDRERLRGVLERHGVPPPGDALEPTSGAFTVPEVDTTAIRRKIQARALGRLSAASGRGAARRFATVPGAAVEGGRKGAQAGWAKRTLEEREAIMRRVTIERLAKRQRRKREGG